MSKKKTVSQSPARISPAWITKTSPRGNKYRVCTVPLSLLPRVLESERLKPKEYFRYAPEGGDVLGVKRIDDQETSEL